MIGDGFRNEDFFLVFVEKRAPPAASGFPYMELVTTKRCEELATAGIPLLLEGVPEGRGSDISNWSKAILEKQSVGFQIENQILCRVKEMLTFAVVNYLIVIMNF